MDEFQVGKITSPHGVKGAFRVFPTTDEMERFSRLKEVFLLHHGEKVPCTVQWVRYQKNMVLLKLKEIDDANTAERYRGDSILIAAKDALPLAEDEYYIRDLYDMEVVQEDGQVLGRLEDILSTGANDVYVVRREDGKELLIPAVKECILDVDVENQMMKIHVMDGLLDL